MADKTLEYGWSTDPEVGFHGKFNSREEAMRNAAKEEFYGDDDETMTVWTCEVEEIDLGNHLPDVDFIFDHMGESLGEEAGEAAENFNPTQEESNAFMDAIENAARTHLKANCWQAANTKRHEVGKDGNEVTE
jgi:hypothetical protein